MGVLTLSGTASAAGFDLQQFHPSANGRGLFGVESADTLEPFMPRLGLSFNYASQPFTAQPETGDQLVLVDAQLIGHLQLAVGFTSWLDMGVDLPFALLQSGSSLVTPDAAISGQGLGDVRLTPRVRVLDGERAPVSLAVVVPLTLGTGMEQDYLGEEGLTVNPQLAVGDKPGSLAWNLAVGYRIRPAVSIYYPPVDGTLQLGNEITYGAAVAYGLTEQLRLGAELEGRLGTAGGSAARPLEARFGGQFETGALSAFAGAGLGILGGYGSPTWRAFVGVSYAFDLSNAIGKDSDGDGLRNRNEQCPEEPEDKDSYQDDDGCPDPDNDRDGVLDAKDACPAKPETVNGVADDDGCPESDKDGDGVPDEVDKCPSDLEDRDGFDDQDGCPDVDNDQDTIIDAQDRCPLEPEDLDHFEDRDGCPDLDNDSDGVIDAKDKCPTKMENKNGYKDDDGCPEPDKDNDGVPDPQDKCPTKMENRNGYKDADGCPEPDSDRDGIPDAIDRCVRQAEVINGDRDQDGCPD